MIAIDGQLRRFMIHLASIVPVAIVLLLLSGCGRALRPGPTAGSPRTVFGNAIEIYRGPLNHLSAVRHGQCPMHPSCSQYSREAIDKHGAVKGWVMAMDRLMRCGRSELSTAPLVQVNGQWRSYDPVIDNDFWWHSKRSSPSEQILPDGAP